MKSIICSIILLVLPLVLLIVFWGQMPDSIPFSKISLFMDQYNAKKSLLLVLTIGTILFFTVSYFIPYVEPNKENYTYFRSTFNKLMLFMVIFMALVNCSLIALFMGWDINVKLILPLCAMALISLIGNYLGKIKPNYLLGIKTP